MKNILANRSSDFISPILFYKAILNELNQRLSYEDLKSYCQKLQINITEEEIKEFLNEKLLEKMLNCTKE